MTIEEATEKTRAGTLADLKSEGVADNRAAFIQRYARRLARERRPMSDQEKIVRFLLTFKADGISYDRELEALEALVFFYDRVLGRHVDGYEIRHVVRESQSCGLPHIQTRPRHLWNGRRAWIAKNHSYPLPKDVEPEEPVTVRASLRQEVVVEKERDHQPVKLFHWLVNGGEYICCHDGVWRFESHPLALDMLRRYRDHLINERVPSAVDSDRLESIARIERTFRRHEVAEFGANVMPPTQRSNQHG